MVREDTPATVDGARCLSPPACAPCLFCARALLFFLLPPRVFAACPAAMIIYGFIMRDILTNKRY